jgi:N-acetylmuramoyl-L-alanine amidase
MLSRLFFFLVFAIAPLFAGALPQITDISIKEDAVTLKLSKPLLSTPKRASLDMTDKTKERYYFDFGATLSVGPKSSKTPSLSEVKVAQFDKQTTRVVIVADKKAKFAIDETKDSVVVRLVEDSQASGVASKMIKKIEKSEKIETQPDKKEDEVTKEEPSPVISAKKKTIVIDPGHGGKDSGALSINGSVQEKDIVLRVAHILRDMLQKKGYKVFLTRENDIFIELQERTRYANQKNADIFISIHANAIDTRYSEPTKFHGIETYFLSPARSERAKKAAEKENGVGFMDAFSKETFLNFLNREKIVASNKLAIDVQRGMLSYAKSKYRDTTDGGVKEAPFWVLVGAQMPAVLVEIGYLTHEGDLEKLQEDYYRTLIAKGIMEGIENYFQNN